MEVERTMQMTQSIGEGSSTTVNEEGIISQVLRKRRWHTNGVGPTLPRKNRSSASTSSSASQSDGLSVVNLPQHVQNWLNNLYIEQCNMFDNQQIMMEVMHSMNPNINFLLVNRPQPLVPLLPKLNKEDEDEDDDAANLGD